jgi:hypothetical protein
LPTVTLAEIYAAQGHLERAVAVLDEVLLREPDHPEAKALRGRFLEQTQRSRARPSRATDTSASRAEGAGSANVAADAQATADSGGDEKRDESGAEADAAAASEGALAAEEPAPVTEESIAAAGESAGAPGESAAADAGTDAGAALQDERAAAKEDDAAPAFASSAEEGEPAQEEERAAAGGEIPGESADAHEEDESAAARADAEDESAAARADAEDNSAVARADAEDESAAARADAEDNSAVAQADDENAAADAEAVHAEAAHTEGESAAAHTEGEGPATLRESGMQSETDVSAEEEAAAALAMPAQSAPEDLEMTVVDGGAAALSAAFDGPDAEENAPPAAEDNAPPAELEEAAANAGELAAPQDEAAPQDVSEELEAKAAPEAHELSTADDEASKAAGEEEDVPNEYDVDEVVAIAVDPETIYIYWEVRALSLARALARRPSGRLALRIVAVTPSWDGPVTRSWDIAVDALFGDRFMRDIPPGANVRVSVGWLDGALFEPFAVGIEIASPPLAPVDVTSKTVGRWTPEASPPARAAHASREGAHPRIPTQYIRIDAGAPVPSGAGGWGGAPGTHEGGPAQHGLATLGHEETGVHGGGGGYGALGRDAEPSRSYLRRIAESYLRGGASDLVRGGASDLVRGGASDLVRGGASDLVRARHV